MNGHGSTNEVLAMRTVSFSLPSLYTSAASSFCPLLRPPRHDMCFRYLNRGVRSPFLTDDLESRINPVSLKVILGVLNRLRR